MEKDPGQVGKGCRNLGCVTTCLPAIANARPAPDPEPASPVPGSQALTLPADSWTGLAAIGTSPPPAGPRTVSGH